ncbi:alpha-amylase [Rhodovulum sp. BSW8]|uniref:Sucrose phosphorylase n=1 Tax=Rhodovulum visakhapatnamense TaxID=364297 RepID=A0A4R8G5X2_9RHOB|nr:MULTISPECIES: sugar phosphorylase [Rhodovulum]OLS46303.1 alpha-amylase [Rhodovulum sulfidophilum]MBL3567964.1 sugar phosphorylase [Rhodovulum visakhapatnamense]MBL3579005.1 sugar phosphorylase [Rhodovulum visakhapatnamense]RBO51732.1 alpha-amylase [Rhodovulum sp. BSW8]TDX30639.1 sucrose phosphorylase [Rhodovulum visakhapatnamense]
MTDTTQTLRIKLAGLVGRIYPDQDRELLIDRIVEAFWPEGARPRRRARMPSNRLWSSEDSMVITYGNSFTDGQHKPLDLLNDFLHRHLEGTVGGVHILPFFPFTSDDGFAVTDYRMVNSNLGDWEDIQRIAGSFRVMSDLVLNHVSSQSHWFSEYRQGHPPYDRFFFEASPEDDLAPVVRPRTSPLLREVETANGPRHVWCTFSHDQVDLDFRNPEVLLEFLRIMRLHVDNGVRIVRLDAVAFLWKEPGTPSIHMPQTHAIVQLMRVLCDFAVEPVVLLTETNVPNHENLSYFGNRNEAHAVYNFSLPPLILHALLSGTAEYLHRWQATMPPAQLGCAYLNFTASHDGIGMRPVEGLLPEEQIGDIIGAIRSFGGEVSMRTTLGGGEAAYELNITWFEAMKGTFAGEDQWQVDRFLCSQTIVMALEGIPAFYVHSLLATPNDHAGVEKTGVKRAINRHRWDYPALLALLDDPSSLQALVLRQMKRRIGIRRRQPAFHPNATQFTLHLDHRLFGLWRQSLERDQSVFALHNVSAEDLSVSPMAINLIGGEDWVDLLSGERISPTGTEIPFAPYQCRWISNRDGAGPGAG